MYLLGHVGFTVFIYWIFEKYQGISSNRNKLIVAIGSMLPDFLDKPIGSLIFHRGRWLGHSILFQLLILSLLLGVEYFKHPYEGMRRDAVLLYFASNMHLVGDLPSIGLNTVFWPLFGPFDIHGSTSFLYGFASTITIVTELIGLSLILLIGWRENWTKENWKFVFTVIIGYIFVYLLTYTILVGL